MNMRNTTIIEGTSSEFQWFNEPDYHSLRDGLVIKTMANTDFWQRTHYGFRRDDGHCYMTRLEGDFSFIAHWVFEPKVTYDQCGIIMRIDEENWVKASIEYENASISRLGSVVTSLGYSDWATTDISSKIKSMWYKFSKNGKDVLIENSVDGIEWAQMRVLHLHKYSETIQVGIYACSPQDSSFICSVKKIIVGQNTWVYEEA